MLTSCPLYSTHSNSYPKSVVKMHIKMAVENIQGHYLKGGKSQNNSNQRGRVILQVNSNSRTTQRRKNKWADGESSKAGLRKKWLPSIIQSYSPKMSTLYNKRVFPGAKNVMKDS